MLDGRQRNCELTAIPVEDFSASVGECMRYWRRQARSLGLRLRLGTSGSRERRSRGPSL